MLNKEDQIMNGWRAGLSLAVGCVLLGVGFVNLFWGNDPFFGLMIVLASGLYALPLASKLYAHLEARRYGWVLLVIALVIIWAALGVGELDDKLELMRASFPRPNITGI